MANRLFNPRHALAKAQPRDASGNSLPRMRQPRRNAWRPGAAAARLFAGSGRLAEGKVAQERAQAGAVEDLVGSGLQPVQATELVGISKRELRGLRPSTPDRPMRVRGPMSGSVSHRTNRSPALEAQGTHLSG
jgi:hypothetical protein